MIKHVIIEQPRPGREEAFDDLAHELIEPSASRSYVLDLWPPREELGGGTGT